MPVLCTIDWSSVFSWDFVGGSVLYMLAVALFLLGIIGCALPYPGHAVLLVGCILFSCARGAPYPGWWLWVILGILALLGSFTDTLLAMLGARRFGCGSASIWCSALGMAIGGIFFFPVGLLAGPFLGAFLCELVYARRPLVDCAKSGTGALIGAILGTLAKFVVAAIMLLLFFLC